MKVIGNLIWLLFGGFAIALEYFAASIVLFVTIIGIPFGIQTIKLGILALWPFGSEVVKVNQPTGCLTTFMNVLWFFVGGFWIMLTHIAFGILFFITIIGIPWGRQHFKLAGLALTPFGRDIIIK
ncbi:MAG: YccF domain-containing protein [Bacteroidota bacterium]